MPGNASVAQYATPTPGPCVACVHSPPLPPHALPTTGYALGWPLLAGVVLVLAGVGLRTMPRFMKRPFRR